MKKLLFLPVILFGLNAAYSQINLGGKPYSFLVAGSTGRTEAFAGKEFKMARIDNDAQVQIAEDLELNCKKCKTYYGKGVPLDIDVKRDGKVIPVEGGTLYVVSLKSETAKGMQFHFSRYKLPKVASLYIYNEDSLVLGAFTHINNHPEGKFATQAIPGKYITIEYFEGNKNEFKGELKILRAIHVFRDGYVADSGSRTQGTAADCENDINCFSQSLYQNSKKGVCRISIFDDSHDLAGYCTGALLNNSDANGNRRGYVLSAYHCYQSGFSEDSKSDPWYWVFEFNYEHQTCDGTVIDFPYESQNGAWLESGSRDYLHQNDTYSSGGDALLLDLQVTDLDEFLDVVFLGWDRRFGSSNHLSTFGIHHPQHDVKKISFDDNSPTEAYVIHDQSGIDELAPSPATAWKVFWNNGITEEGSSGSPLIDGYKVIGALSGGVSRCLPNQPIVTGPDYYSHLGYVWDKTDFSFYSIGQRLTTNPDVIEQMNEYVPPPPGSGGNPGGGPGTICPLYNEGVLGNPTTAWDFNNEPLGVCGFTTWKVHNKTAEVICIKTADNAANRAVALRIKNTEGADISKHYTFYPDRDYVVTIKVASTTYSQPNLGTMRVVLRTSVPSTNCPSSATSGMILSPSDQIIMTLPPSQLFHGTAKFGTYAVKFRPTQQYSDLVIKYSEGVNYPGTTEASSIYIDDVFVYQNESFINNQCYNDQTYSSLSATLYGNQIMTNNSLTVEFNPATPTFSPIVVAGQTMDLKSKLIYLKAGFRAEAGSTFTARIGEAIDYTTPTTFVGPLETPNNSPSVRTMEAPAPDPTVVFNYYDMENIYSIDLLEASAKSNPVLFDEQRILVSPNPTKGKVIGRYITKREEVPYAIYDAFGRELIKGISGNTFEFDLGNYGEGIYILKANVEGRNEIAKIVLKK